MYSQIRGGQALAGVIDLGADGGVCPNAVDLYGSHGPAFGKNGTYTLDLACDTIFLMGVWISQLTQ